MKAGAKRGRPHAMLGFLKAFGMLFALLFLVPYWMIRNARTRARFRGELISAGIPKEAAKRLSDRYKVRLRDFRSPASAES
jgi:hypothetical protein